MDKSDILLVVKSLLFAFIITSPFYNVSRVFSFADNTVFKIVILLLVVWASFVDMQLALVAAIAFFILMLHFNTSTVFSSPTQQKVDMPFKHAFLSSSDAASASAAFPVVPLGPQVPQVPQVHAGVAVHPQEHQPVLTSNSIYTPPVPVEPLPSVDQKGPSEAKVMHNMYEFPQVKCVAPVEATDAYMNESVVNYYLDPKIKPYEDFIAQLTNEELLDSVSNGAFLQ